MVTTTESRTTRITVNKPPTVPTIRRKFSFRSNCVSLQTMSNMAANYRMATNAHAAVFAYTYTKDNVDCRFRFVDDITHDEQLFPAHQKVLAAISPVFRVMFDSNWNAGDKPIDIEDVSFELFATFMDYFYDSGITLTAENAVGILHLADKYDVGRLVDHCETFLIEQLSVDNALAFCSVAVRYERDQLVAECHGIFRRKYDAILRSDEFFDCGKATLAAFLRCLPESCDTVKIFDVCMKWAEAKCKADGMAEPAADSLRSALGDCFALIRFKDMDYRAFVGRYEKYKMMFTKDESDAIFVHLLKSLDDRHHSKSLDNCRMVVTGIHENRVSVGNELCFKVSVPMILHKVTVPPVLHSTKPSNFPGIINILRNDRKVLTCTAEFSPNKRTHITLKRKITIDADVAHTVMLTDTNYNPIVAVHAYTHKRQRIGNADFIPMYFLDRRESGSKGINCSIESLEFINFDKLCCFFEK